MSRFILLLSCVFSTMIAIGQTQKGTISISVMNNQNSPLENATAELMLSKDSSLVKAAVTDKAGIASFESVAYGQYIIKVSMTGYTAQYSNAITLDQSEA